MSVVPPEFRPGIVICPVKLSYIQLPSGRPVLPVCLLSVCTTGMRAHSDNAFPDNGGKSRWRLLAAFAIKRQARSIQSSKATSMLPSRRFPPTIFSLSIRITCTPPRQRFCLRLLPLIIADRKHFVKVNINCKECPLYLGIIVLFIKFV